MGKMIQGVIYALVLALAGLVWRLIYAHYAVAEIQHTLVNFGHQQQVIALQQQQHWMMIAQQQHESPHLAGDEEGWQGNGQNPAVCRLTM